MLATRWTRIAFAVVTAIVLGGAALFLRQLTRDRPLSLADFELSAAEIAASDWVVEVQRARKTRSGSEEEIVERLFARCRDYASLIVYGTREDGVSPSSKSPEKQVELHKNSQECLDGSGNDERAFLTSPLIEGVPRAQALAWWPYDLFASPVAQSGLVESVFVISKGHGLAGDPKTETSAVVFAYTREKKPASTHSFEEVLNSGGWAVISEWRSASGEHPSGRDGLGERIDIHFAAARLMEISPVAPEESRGILAGQVHRRFVSWDGVARSGRLRFEVVTSPLRYSRGANVDLIASLRNVGEQQGRDLS